MKNLINLSLLLLALMLPVNSIAQDFNVDGIYYCIEDSKAAVISSPSSSKYTGNITIPASVIYGGTTYPVTSIYPEAFSGCTDLTSIDIPNSVTTIYEHAFLGCSGLTSITIPNSVTYIGALAFFNCSIETVIFNAISCVDFYCTLLFDGTIYDDGRVFDSHVKTIIFGENVQRIPDFFAYGLTGLTSITIPNSVKSIGKYAFNYCRGLTNVSFGNSVTTIGDYAFQDCYDLTSINIPNSVTNIGRDAFYRCSGLANIMVASGNSVFDSRDNCNAIIETASNTLITGCMNTTIPNSVTTIGEYAFYACVGLTSISIPNSVTTIGYEAFSYCRSLTSVTIGNSVTNIDRDAFYDCSGITDLVWNARDCNMVIPKQNIVHVTIGPEVEIIPGYFMNGSLISEIAIPNSVTAIGEHAFDNCSRLVNLTIGNSVTTIGSDAFYGCSGLANIMVASGNSVFDSRDNCNAIIETASNTLMTGCMNTTIPNSVITIGNNAFYNCSGLASIDIPNSVTTIGSYAFSGCNRLKDVFCHINNPSSVSLGSDAFYLQDSWRYALRTLHIPSGSLAEYTSSNWYNYFGSFIEMDEGGIVTAIELDKDAVVVIDGETLQLTAFITPENATNKTVAWSTSDPAVATVDENGLVTGLSVGTATITAMTTDGSNLSASCLVTVKTLSTDNCFSMPDNEVLHGESIAIPVQLNNTESIMAFQTDLYLPEGFSLVTDEDDEPVITPSNRLTSDHIIMAEHLNDGGVRILCYNTSERIISGTEGDLFYITVNTPEDAVGDYAIYLRNSRLTNMDYNEIHIPDAGAVLSVNTFIPGDVNDSHNVNVTDIVVAAQYVLQRNPSPFIFEAADMNGDGEVTVTDIMLIARLILYPTTMNAPRQAPATMSNSDSMSGESILLHTGDTCKVSIALDNVSDYIAFQLDMNLPDGLMAGNFELTDRAGSHTLDVDAIENSKIRALCYSPAIESIVDNSGVLLTFDVTAFAPVAGDITVDGIEMVTTTCQPVLLDAFIIGVNTQTAVNELTTGKTIDRVDYYNVAGQHINRPENGVTLVVTTYTDGTRATTKLIY